MIYHPNGTNDLPKDKFRILIVEGNLGGGYDMGLDNAIQLTETLAEQYHLPVELMVVGKISEEHKARFNLDHRFPFNGLVPCRANKFRRLIVLLICFSPPISMPPARTRSSRRWLAGFPWLGSIPER